MIFEAVVSGLQWEIGDLRVTMEYFGDGAYDYEMDSALSRELGLGDFKTWLREDSKFENLLK